MNNYFQTKKMINKIFYKFSKIENTREKASN